MATGEKRSAAESEVAAHQECKAILLDVEGTTTSISFVKDTLFPYVREVLKKHIDEKWNTDELKDDLAKLKGQAKEDEENKVDGFIPIKEDTEEEAKESLIKNVLWQMDNDRKTGALKQLQGHIWKAGHKPIKGHVYDDVPKAFEEWTSNGKKLYIYSSGSVEAQKLLYGDSVHGNLLKYISGHFDTEVGPKQEAASYTKIMKQINHEPSDVLFLTDVVKEAEAAKEAGVSTIIVVREGNAKLSDNEKAAFKTIESFAEISFQSVNKRQKLDEKTEKDEKDASVEEKKISETATVEPVCEPMDTSEDVEMKEDEKKPETTSDDKLVETKGEEKPIKAEKSADKVETTEGVEKIEKAEKDEKVEKVEKEVTPMEEETVKEDTVAKTESEKSEVAPETEVKESAEKPENKTENKQAEVSEEKPKSEELVEAEKKTEEAEKKPEEIEVKSEETPKVSETAEEKKVDVEKKVEETVPTEAAAEKTKESDAEKVAEITTEAVTEKPAEVAKEQTEEKKVVEEETKSEEKENTVAEKKPIEEVKENGSAAPAEPEKLDKVENKENIENVDEKAKDEKTAEVEVEKAEEAKETVDSTKAETEPQKEAETKKLNGTTTNGNSTNDAEVDKVHSNGVSEEVENAKENGDAEESIKVKKAVVAEGTGGPDVVTPPVVAATS